VSSYQPPCTVTVEILSQVATIAEAVGRLHSADGFALKLRRANRIRSIHGSLAIEGNTLTETQMTAILDGQRVVAPPREIQEVRNAIKVYDQIAEWNPDKEEDLLSTHALLMEGLIDSAPFITYMLQVILSTLESLPTPQDSPQVTPQVKKLLNALKGEMSRGELMDALSLSDAKSFRQRYLLPALTEKLIEMTIPDKPNSRLQKYRLVRV
jgi:Fic family protein